MNQFLIITFCLFPFLINGQVDDYHILKLWKGSSLLGKIIEESDGKVTFENNFSDTLIIKRRSIVKRYLIEESNYYRGDFPKLTRGMYKTFFIGCGGGRRTINPFESPFLGLFPIPAITEAPIIVTKFGGSVGYQFNKNFGLGIGANYYLYRQERRFFIDAGFHPYVQLKFNYEPPNWNDKNIFFIANALQQTEFIGGISFIRPRRTYKVGFAYYQNYNDFIRERHLSIQAGIQF